MDLPPGVIRAEPTGGTVRVPVPRFYQPGSETPNRAVVGSVGGSDIGGRVGSSADQYRAGVIGPDLSRVAARRSLSTLVERYGRGADSSALTSVEETRASLERIAARRSTMSDRDSSRLDYSRGPIDRLANPDRRPTPATTERPGAPTVSTPLVPSDRTQAPVATRSSRLANLRVTDPERARRLADGGRTIARVQDEMLRTGVAAVGGRALAKRMRNQTYGDGANTVRPGSGSGDGTDPDTSDSYYGGYWGSGYNGYGYHPYSTACYPGWYWGNNYGNFWNPFCWGWYGVSSSWYWGWSTCYPSYYGNYFGNYHNTYGFGGLGGFGYGGFGAPLYYSTALYAAQEQQTQPVQVVIYNEPASEQVVYAEAPADPGPGFDPNAAGLKDVTFGDGLDLSSDRYLTLGDRAFRDGNWTQAAEYYTKATELEPEVGVLYLVLSDALFAAGDYGHSAVAIRRAFTLEPELARSTVDKTEFYADAADFERHLDTARRFLDSNPANSDARLALAVNELFSARLDAAAATLMADTGALATDSASALVRGAISARR